MLASDENNIFGMSKMVDDVILEERCTCCSSPVKSEEVKKSRADLSREKSKASTVAYVEVQFKHVCKAVDDAASRGETYIDVRISFHTHDQFLEVKRMLQVDGYNVMSSDKRESNNYELRIAW